MNINDIKSRLGGGKKVFEDEVREYAGYVLGFENTETAQSGTGQIKTFNQLGFTGILDKPDGWYLPNDKHFPAIILEAKASDVKLEKHIGELLKNCDIAGTKYKKVIGILYNGYEIIILKNKEKVPEETELQNKEYISDCSRTTTLIQTRFTTSQRI